MGMVNKDVTRCMDMGMDMRMSRGAWVWTYREEILLREQIRIEMDLSLESRRRWPHHDALDVLNGEDHLICTCQMGYVGNQGSEGVGGSVGAREDRLVRTEHRDDLLRA